MSDSPNVLLCTQRQLSRTSPPVAGPGEVLIVPKKRGGQFVLAPNQRLSMGERLFSAAETAHAVSLAQRARTFEFVGLDLKGRMGGVTARGQVMWAVNGATGAVGVLARGLQDWTNLLDEVRSFLRRSVAKLEPWDIRDEESALVEELKQSVRDEHLRIVGASIELALDAEAEQTLKDLRALEGTRALVFEGLALPGSNFDGTYNATVRLSVQIEDGKTLVRSGRHDLKALLEPSLRSAIRAQSLKYQSNDLGNAIPALEAAVRNATVDSDVSILSVSVELEPEQEMRDFLRQRRQLEYGKALKTKEEELYADDRQFVLDCLERDDWIGILTRMSTKPNNEKILELLLRQKAEAREDRKEKLAQLIHFAQQKVTPMDAVDLERLFGKFMSAQEHPYDLPRQAPRALREAEPTSSDRSSVDGKAAASRGDAKSVSNEG
jgi:hypothetical protein